jgi:serine/threonine protein kinase
MGLTIRSISMSFTVGENVGPYRIIEQLGQGGMATVFKAYHAALDRYVALKVLHPAFLEDPNFLARFQREARVVAKLDHPNIVPIFDYAEHGGRPYLVMKFIEGATLKAALSHGLLTPDRILQIVEAVGAALSFAHKRGILHRDIKPSNVLLSDEGQIYLADFGLARIAQSGASTMTSDMILGTPQYISPEQALGKKDLDEGTDIYSFGVMLYELAVGKVPFSADTPFSVIHDHIYSPLPMPRAVNPTVSEELERVLLKALSKERADRYKDVGTLVEAFKHAWIESTPPMPLEIETTVKIEPHAPATSVEPTMRAEVPTPVPAVQTETPAEEDAAQAEPPVPAAKAGTPEEEETTQAEPIIPMAAEQTEISPAAEESAQAETPAPAEAVLPPVQKAPVPPSQKKFSWVWGSVAAVLVLACIVGLFGLRGIQRRRLSAAATQTAEVHAAVRTPTAKAIATKPPAYPMGVLFQANFDNGQVPEDWDMGSGGWSIKDGILCGNGHSFASAANGDVWKDYAVKFRMRLDSGTINLNLRQRPDSGELDRYFITVEKAGLNLNKQTAKTFQNNLATLDYFFPVGTWMDVTMVAQGNRVMILVNGVIVVDYTDSLSPFGTGTFTLETIENSAACVDSIVVSDLTGKPPFDLLYEQHFDTAQSLNGWEITNAEGKQNQSWLIKDGALCGSWHNWAVLKDMPLNDFAMTYRLSMKSGSAHLNFRVGEGYRYYTIIGPVDSEVSLSKDTKEQSGKSLAIGHVQILPDQWYDIMVNVIGGHIQFWVNHKAVYDFTDQAPLAGGRIGFESLDAQDICIDDLVITMPSLVQNP